MRFVTPKTIEQEDLQAVHRIRSRLVEERTALINQIRGLLAEYGIVISQGINNVRKKLPEILEDGEKNSYVYTVTNSNGKTGTAKKVMVKVGQSADNVTEILSGLTAEDSVVTEGVNAISDGMKLNF